MNLKLTLIILFAIYQGGVYGQTTGNFEPVSSKGTIPSELLKSKSKKIKEAIESAKKNATTTKKSKQKKLESYEASNAFLIDELMFSGDVLYNDIYGVYLNKIKDELLAHDEELRNSIKVYTLKSPVANAFTFNDGKVFFNIGLFAYMKTEAEVAFVLAHEISHYTSKHSLKRFEKTTEINTKGEIRKKSEFYEVNQFSQEQEKEADKKALEIFYKSKYRLSNALTTMEELERTDYPIFDYKFPREMISNSKLVFNNKFELDSIKPIVLSSLKVAEEQEEKEKKAKEELENKDKRKKLDKKKKEEKEKKLTKAAKTAKDKDAENEYVEEKETKDEYNPLESTHPESPLRKKILMDNLKADKKDETVGEDYVVYTQAEFDDLKMKSKVEVTREFLLSHNYELASYYAGGLLQQDSNNFYYKKLFAKALGGFALYSNHNWSYVHYRFNKMKGHYSDYLFMMYMMRKTDKALFLTTALNYCYKEFKANPNDPELNTICVALTNRLNDEFKIDHKFFKDIEISKEKFTGEKPKKEVYKKEKPSITYTNSKSKSKKKEKTEKRDDLVKASLVEYENDDLFKNLFEEGKNYEKTRKALTEDEIKFKKFIEKNNVGTIKKVLVYQPQFSKYKKIDITSDKLAKYEKRADEFRGQIEEAASLAGVEVEFLDSRGLTEKDVDKLNDIMRLQEYANNMTNNDILYKPNFLDIGFTDSLREKYKTDHIMLLSAKPIRNSLALPIIYTIFGFIPYTIPELLMGGSAFNFFAATLNLSTGDVDYAHEYSFKMKDNKLIERSILYSFFNDIAHTKYRLEFNEGEIKF